MRIKPTQMSAALTVLALSACGGTGTQTDITPYVANSALFTATSPTTALNVVGLDRNSENTFADTTTLTPPSTLSGGRLDGTVSYSYTAQADNKINLSSGGSATLIDNGTRYAFGFGNANMIGIAGVPATNIPTSNTATYRGFADVNVNDGSGAPKLLTSSVTTARFSSNSVDVYLDNSTSDWIRINNATIAGDGYSGGTMSVSSTFATDPVTSGALQHEGKFFGDSAKEVGGAFILDRTGAGVNFKAQGIYGGNDGS